MSAPGLAFFRRRFTEAQSSPPRGISSGRARNRGSVYAAEGEGEGEEKGERKGTYGLVLEEHLGVEVRDLALGVDGGADHLALACVHEGAHLEDLGGRAEVALSETTTA